jgi:hypothetical protein
MSAIVVAGDTSGSVTLQAPAVSGTTVITLPATSGTMITNKSAGTVLQVVNATYSTETSSSSSTFADTGLTASITPTSATSKILILVNQNGCGKAIHDTNMYVRLLRNSTTISHIERIAGSTSSTADNFIGSISSCYLDSPATASAVTYKTQFASASNSSAVIVQGTFGAETSTSTITLMEIAA